MSFPFPSSYFDFFLSFSSLHNWSCIRNGARQFYFLGVCVVGAFFFPCVFFISLSFDVIIHLTPQSPRQQPTTIDAYTRPGFKLLSAFAARFPFPDWRVSVQTFLNCIPISIRNISRGSNIPPTPASLPPYSLTIITRAKQFCYSMLLWLSNASIYYT